MKKLIIIGVLVVLGVGAYFLGSASSNKNSGVKGSFDRSSARNMRGLENIKIEGVDLSKKEPSVRGRVSSVENEMLVVSSFSRPSGEEERNFQRGEGNGGDWQERRGQMENMTDEQRNEFQEKMRAQRENQPAEEKEFSVGESTKVVKMESLEGEAKEISLSDVGKGDNVTVWALESDESRAEIVLVMKMNK